MKTWLQVVPHFGEVTIQTSSLRSWWIEASHENHTLIKMRDPKKEKLWRRSHLHAQDLVLEAWDKRLLSLFGLVRRTTFRADSLPRTWQWLIDCGDIAHDNDCSSSDRGTNVGCFAIFRSRIYSSDAEIFICSCLYRILNATNISIISLLLVILDQRQFCGGLSSNLALTIYNAINE